VVESHLERPMPTKGRRASPIRLFLSHAHADKDVAELFEPWVNDAFHDLVTVFRSSDRGVSIKIGDEIKLRIKKAIKDSVASIMLCSHTSINRPWVNIEFGAAWMLNTAIIPLCLPGLQVSELPFQISGMKVCELASEASCIELLQLLLERVNARFPYSLQDNEITRHGKELFKRVDEVIKRRAVPDRPPARERRSTIWIVGSYSGLGPRELSIAHNLVPIVAKGLVDLEVRAVMGESDMLREFADNYRDAAIASKVTVPNPIILPGKLRQRDLTDLFRDAISVVPDLALFIGGGTRGRVQEEHGAAVAAGIPTIVIPATGGAAASLKSTAHKADHLAAALNKIGRDADSGDLANAILKAVALYAGT
jgi:hypothetical protein